MGANRAGFEAKNCPVYSGKFGGTRGFWFYLALEWPAAHTFKTVKLLRNFVREVLRPGGNIGLRTLHTWTLVIGRGLQIRFVLKFQRRTNNTEKHSVDISVFSPTPVATFAHLEKINLQCTLPWVLGHAKQKTEPESPKPTTRSTRLKKAPPLTFRSPGPLFPKKKARQKLRTNTNR